MAWYARAEGGPVTIFWDQLVPFHLHITEDGGYENPDRPLRRGIQGGRDLRHGRQASWGQGWGRVVAPNTVRYASGAV